MGLAETAELLIDLQMKEEVSATSQKALSSVKGLESGVQQFGARTTSGMSVASAGFAKLGAAAKGAGNALSHAGSQLKGLVSGPLGMVGLGLGAVGAAQAFHSIVSSAGDFEAALHTINTVADVTDSKLQEIGNGLRDMSKKSGVALDDLTTAYYDLVSAGIKVGDAQSILNDAVTLGIGGLATTAETVDLLTTAVNVYGLNAEGAAKATDMFAQAVQDGKVKASQIAATFADIGPIAKQFGVGIDQIAASYAALTAKGVPAGEVATQMQRAITSLISPSKALAKAQKDLNINFTEEIRKKGLVPALQELRVYADKNKIPLIDLLGRIEAVKFTLNTTGSEFQNYEAELAKMAGAHGVAARQMEERQQGFNFQIARLGANVKDAAITIGSALLPALGDLADEATTFLSGHQDDIKAFGQTLAGAIRNLIDIGRTAVDVLGGIWTGFTTAWNAIPAPLRDLLLKGFIADRTVKFLFGFSPVQFATEALMSGLSRAVGVGIASAGLGKLFVQPVFVTNWSGMPGGGIPGIGGGGGSAGGLAGILGMFLSGPGIAAAVAAVAAKAAADIANQEFADKGLKSNLVAPGAGTDNLLLSALPFGIGSSLNNIADTLDRVFGGGKKPEVTLSGPDIEAIRGGVDPTTGVRPSERHFDVTNRKTTASQEEARRGRQMGALAAAEVKKGVRGVEQDIEQLRGVIKPAVAGGVKQGVGPDIEKLRAATASGLQKNAGSIGGDIESMRGRIASGLSGVKHSVDRKKLSASTKVSTSVKNNTTVTVSAAAVSKAQYKTSINQSASYMNTYGNLTGDSDPRAGR